MVHVESPKDQWVLYLMIYFVVFNFCTSNKTCTIKKSSETSKGFIYYLERTCCKNEVRKNGNCEECPLGEKVYNQTDCIPCTGQFYGWKCAYICTCTKHQWCSKADGCLPADFKFTVATMDEYTKKNTNVAPTNADDVARTDGYTKNTKVAPTNADDVDNGYYEYSAFLPQTIIIVIGSTMIILVIFLIFKEYLSKIVHVNVINHTAETEVVDQSIIILNEETNNYEDIDESIIMQSDTNAQKNSRSRCVEHSDRYSGDTGNYLNTFTASVYENAGRKEEENDYENYSRSNMDSVDDTYQNTCMYESLRGQRNSNDGYSSCRSVQIDEDTETEYATIVGEICLYKS